MRPLILHPFFFASFASLSLVANNLSETSGGGGRAVVISVAAAGLIYLLFWLFTRDALRAGLCATGAIVLFFSYGHILNLLAVWKPNFNWSAMLWILWAALMALWIYWVLRISKNPLPVSNTLNIVGIVLNVVPIYTILTFSADPVNTGELVSRYADRIRPTVAVEAPAVLPDIYFVVLDAYARGDVLEDIYEYDNSPFLADLAERGFYVDEAARANYTHSEISIASSLNMSYFTDLPQYLREKGASSTEDSVNRAASEMIRDSALQEILEGLGYTIVAFDSGYGSTQIADADEYVSSPGIEDAGLWQIGIELMLLDTTLGRELVGLLGEEASPHRKLFTAHRDRVLFSLDTLPQYAEDDEPQFVFAHIISPHVPFVFGPNGEEIAGIDAYTLLDARGGNEANIELYRNQLHYLNTRVLHTIEQILEQSEPPPIIILQADHGSKVYSEPNPPQSVQMDLLIPILKAIHAPGTTGELFQESTTPVNTFRLILNHYFEADLDLLPDTSYVLESAAGETNFVDACAKYAACRAP